jgi:RNA polymerase sigma-70 factor, ECF subfamily
VAVIKPGARSDVEEVMSEATGTADAVTMSQAPIAQGALALSDRERGRRLRAWVDAHWSRVARVLRHLGVPEADLDDGLQQVFMVASAKAELIRPGAERAFLVQTAVHMAARFRRAIGKAREIPTDDADAPDGAASPEELVDRERAMRKLDSALATMTAELRSVFVLYEIEEMTMADIAETLQIPPGTVASRLRRARELFREAVAQTGSPGEKEQP